jgi:hypothetical protein
MSKWNLRLDDNLVELEGRTLEPETINYSDRSVRYKQQEADWSRDGKKKWNISTIAIDFNRLVFKELNLERH